MRVGSTCPLSLPSSLQTRALYDVIRRGTDRSRMEQQNVPIALLMSMSRLCYMKPICRLHSRHLLLMHTYMLPTCILLFTLEIVQLHMNSGISRSLMCHTFECGAALPMCMCRKTRETILEYISRGASLLVIQLSTRGGDFTTPSQDDWLLESMRSLMNATSLATTLLYWIVVQTPLSSHSSICLIRHQRYPLNLWLYVMTGEMTSLVSMHLLQLHPSHYLPHPHHPFQVALPLLTLWNFPIHRLLHHLLSNHLHHPQLVLLHATAFMNRKLNTSRQQNGGNCPRHLLLLSLTMSQRTVMMNCCCNQGVYWLLPMKGILPVLNCRLPMLLQCTRFTLLSTLAIPDHIMKQ